MGRSPGFGSTTKYSTPYSDSLSLRLHSSLNLACNRNSPVHSTKARHHPLTGSDCCKHTVSSSFHSLPGYFSPFPHGTGSLSVTRGVFSLAGWSRGFRRNFTCSVVLRIHSREYIFNYRIITFFDSTFQMIRLIYSFVTPYRVSYNPNKQAYWFGLFRFARRYSGNRFSFSSSGY